MNWMDRLIANLSPSWAMQRVQARSFLAAYEAAQPSRLRRSRGDNASGDALTQRSGENLRAMARHLDQNHDLAHGALDVLVRNLVGPTGIGIEPQPRRKDGSIHVELAREIGRLYMYWSRSPEVTGEHQWASVQRLACRAWLRDGEALAQHIEGPAASVTHGSRVPYSLEMIEADLLPHGMTDLTRNIMQGVERNEWGRVRAYHLLKKHPGDVASLMAWTDTKAVAGDRIVHLKLVDRVRQARGVSIFASVMTRLDDLKEYEESERVAARISAALAAFVRKGTPDLYQAPSGDATDREFKLKPGMVFDNLAVGEEIGTIQSNRPSALLQPFRDSMLRAVAAGVGTGYSSLSKSYDGSYSAQRQELVEQYAQYGVLSDEFIARFVQPIYLRFIAVAVASGVLKLPPDLDRATLDDADYRPPVMPWIDPQREAGANEKLLALRVKSRAQIIRERGGIPADVRDQTRKEREEDREDGVLPSASAPTAPDDSDPPA